MIVLFAICKHLQKYLNLLMLFSLMLWSLGELLLKWWWGQLLLGYFDPGKPWRKNSNLILTCQLSFDQVSPGVNAWKTCTNSFTPTCRFKPGLSTHRFNCLYTTCRDPLFALLPHNQCCPTIYVSYAGYKQRKHFGFCANIYSVKKFFLAHPNFIRNINTIFS